MPETLTDKEPGADEAPYGIRVHDVWCRTCRARAQAEKAHQHIDEKLAESNLDEAPGRYLMHERIPTTE